MTDRATHTLRTKELVSSVVGLGDEYVQLAEIVRDVLEEDPSFDEVRPILQVADTLACQARAVRAILDPILPERPLTTDALAVGAPVGIALLDGVAGSCDNIASARSVDDLRHIAGLNPDVVLDVINLLRAQGYTGK